MSEDTKVLDFGDGQRVLAYIQQRSKDLVYVVIPQLPCLTLTNDGVHYTNVEVGMVLEFVGGGREFLTPGDAEVVLNDGLLNRLKLEIRLRNQAEGHLTSSH